MYIVQHLAYNINIDDVVEQLKILNPYTLLRKELYYKL